jgi:carbon monoxide dehydrogenase subunit G
MELSNSFTVDVPVERAWEVLTDVPTIAPCLPGAQLQEVEGDEYRGVVKVKVGPITAQYKGAATFLERDDDAHRAVIRGQGRETRGQGNATAVITAQLRSAGDDRTEVEVTTDLTVTGKVASLGRGAMAEVSAKLMDQFAENLRTTVLADDAGPAADAAAEETGAEEAAVEEAAPETPAPASERPVPVASSAPAGTNGRDPESARPGVQTFDQPEPEAIDLLDAAGAPVLKRLVPAVLVGVVVLILLRVLLRRRSRGTD